MYSLTCAFMYVKDISLSKNLLKVKWNVQMTGRPRRALESPKPLQRAHQSCGRSISPQAATQEQPLQDLELNQNEAIRLCLPIYCEIFHSKSRILYAQNSASAPSLKKICLVMLQDINRLAGMDVFFLPMQNQRQPTEGRSRKEPSLF